MSVCPNCGSTAVSKYCAECGQRISDVRMSVGRLLRDVLEDQFSLNSSLFRTLGALFFRPGLLTREYLDLRIARYIPPFRLYLIATLLFFLLASFFTSRAEFNINRGDRAEIDSARAAAGDTSGMRLRTSRESRGGIDFTVTGDNANWLDSVRVNLGNERINALFRKRIEALGDLPPEQAIRRFSVAFVEQSPKVMFLLLPVYAFILKLLYVFKRRYYVEHFVFALHVHAFIFLLFFLMMLIRQLPVVVGLLTLWIPIYTLVAMKRVYQQGWIVTFAKWSMLGFAYMLLLSFGLLAALLAALMTV